MKRIALITGAVIYAIIAIPAALYFWMCLIAWIGQLIFPSAVIWGMPYVHPVWFFIALVIVAPLLTATILEDIQEAVRFNRSLPAARSHPAPPDEDAYYRDHLYNDQESNE